MSVYQTDSGTANHRQSTAIPWAKQNALAQWLFLKPEALLPSFLSNYTHSLASHTATAYKPGIILGWMWPHVCWAFPPLLRSFTYLWSYFIFFSSFHPKNLEEDEGALSSALNLCSPATMKTFARIYHPMQSLSGVARIPGYGLIPFQEDGQFRRHGTWLHKWGVSKC